MGKGHVSVVSRPGTQQLSRKCWLVNNEGTLPSAGCPHLLHQLTGWWFWLFESPCYPKRKTFAPNSKAKELPSPEEDLSFWTPELLPFWVLTLSTSPSSPQPCQQYPHSLFSSGQNTLLPLATSLPEAATPL